MTDTRDLWMEIAAEYDVDFHARRMAFAMKMVEIDNTPQECHWCHFDICFNRPQCHFGYDYIHTFCSTEDFLKYIVETL